MTSYAITTVHYQELLGYCARQLGSRDDAADIVQEAYLRILSGVHAAPSPGIENPRALLYRTVRNLLVDQYRRNRVRDHASLQELDEQHEPAAPCHLQPDEVLAFQQYAQAMMQAIEALPPRCREVFVLNRFEGWSHQQIAEHLGISRNMVAQHIIRAVLSCKQVHQRFQQI